MSKYILFLVAAVAGAAAGAAQDGREAGGDRLEGPASVHSVTDCRIQACASL